MACAKISSDGSYNKILTRAVTLILEDEGFSLLSVSARRVLERAEKLLEWSGDYEIKSAWRTFEDELIGRLIVCFHHHQSIRTRRERMWEDYVYLWSWPDTSSLWRNQGKQDCFLESVTVPRSS